MAIGLLTLSIMVGGLIYLFGPHKDADPMDIVQGTGADLGEYQFEYIGPSELEVRWDEATGEPWSPTWVKGWARNASDKTVTFEKLVYRTRDEDGNIIWEEEDERFSEGFALKPMDYITITIMPICKRPARLFELAVEGVLIE